MSQTLTYTLHSLVRVSRRGDFEHFVHDFDKVTVRKNVDTLF